MKIKCSIIFMLMISINSFGQKLDSLKIYSEPTNLEEALKNAENIKILNLSNQTIQFEKNFFSKFTNLEYLVLKNDHIKELPIEIGGLKKLKFLDLSGNDFEIIPKEYKNLLNLEELYLNDELYFNLEKNMGVLSSLPNLKSLHLSNDKLDHLPNNFNKLETLEKLYIDNNNFKILPKQIKGLDHLQLLDIGKNPLQMNQTDILNFGFKIKL